MDKLFILLQHIAPQHLLITPKGQVLARKAYQASKNDLFHMMTLAEKELARQAGGGEDEVVVRPGLLEEQVRIVRVMGRHGVGPAAGKGTAPACAWP